jgi:hypothetical protein
MTHRETTENPEERHQGFDVVCSSCGTMIRSGAAKDSERMCLICYARMLNNYFQEVRKNDRLSRPDHHQLDANHR